MSRKSIKHIFTHPTPGGPASRGGGGVGGSKFQNCGKFHEQPRKSIKKKNSSIKHIFTHPTPGGPASRGGGWGVKISKLREISRTAEKIDKKNKNSAQKITKTCNPHPTPSDGGGGVRGKNVNVTKLQGLKSISGMQLS